MHDSDLRLGDDEEIDTNTAVNYVEGGSSSGDICGVIIDKKSGQGYVCLYQIGQVSSEPRIATGPEEEGYEYLEIGSEQGFLRFGSAAVLYIYHK
jgi:hypothetical protein